MLSLSLSLSLFSLKAYMPHRIHWGQKSTSSGVPIHVSTGVLLLAMQALLVTLMELFFNYKRSAGGGELGLPESQGKQASQNR
jgi:hypothetical protein